MFQRRLKIVLLVLLLMTLALVVRAAQVQVVEHRYWIEQSGSLLQRTQTSETTRGRILDIKFRPLALDVPCTDACVDYQAIIDPPDPKWLADVVTARLQRKLGATALRHASSAQLASWKSQETAQTLVDLRSMWSALAEFYRPDPFAVAASEPTDDDEDSKTDPAPIDRAAAIAEIRRGIVLDVDTQRRRIVYETFQRDQTRAADLPRWQRWIAGGHAGTPDDADLPDDEDLTVPTSGQTEPHVILHKLDASAVNFLGKRLERFPGLSLLPSTRRSYPMQTVAAHVLGRMSEVIKDDVDRSKDWDPSRRYRRTDEIGREGIEALCEPLLRGRRGTTRRRVGDDAVLERTPFVPGQDVRLSIDADLQADLQHLLQNVRIHDRGEDGKPRVTDPISMHSAAVVIDVPTGELRALASNPGFDLDTLDTQYATLMADKLNAPLRDRATSDAFEPGSTVKPMVGLGAITDGLLTPTEGIECTGYLVLPVYDAAGRPTGRTIKEPTGRCWVASEWSLADLAKYGITSYAHHPIPLNDPHVGRFGNPNGFLCYADALERSCNVFFETVADRLGPRRLGDWYDAFGFGKKTGIGIAENAGLRPDPSKGLVVTRRMSNCFAGIGEGQVWATPLQIANEAATIARDGVWKRPRLLSADSQAALDTALDRTDADKEKDTVDLHLSSEGLEQAKQGMVAVVNAVGGTGAFPRSSIMYVAGKTGSAQGARLWETVTDANGRPVRDPAGRPRRAPLMPATFDQPDTPTPWYRMKNADDTNVVHAWFMGFAPADHPQIAFCVLIEYSGAAGDGAAGPVAKLLLEACSRRGYLKPGRSPMPLASAD